MRKIALVNQKGGVGKTTSTVNLGAALARLGARVLIIDLDPQSNTTIHLGLRPAECKNTTYALLSWMFVVKTVNGYFRRIMD